MECGVMCMYAVDRYGGCTRLQTRQRPLFLSDSRYFLIHLDTAFVILLHAF